MSCGAFAMFVNGEQTRVSHAFVKKNIVQYISPHERFAHCPCKNATLTLDLSLSGSAAGSCCIFALAVRQPPVLASGIEIYYSHIYDKNTSLARMLNLFVRIFACVRYALHKYPQKYER